MKAMSMTLDAGSVIAWKEYSPIKKFWYNLRRRELPYNKFTIVPSKTELIIVDGGLGFLLNATVYEPIRKYSRAESGKLDLLCGDAKYNNEDWVEIANIINLVRPNTFSGPTTLDTSKYYKKVKYHEKLGEYIY